jgi:hypothetical protein
MNRRNIISLVVGFVLCALLLQFCEGKNTPDKVKTVIKTIKVTDTLMVKGGVTTKYKNVFIRKTDTSVVYLEKADSTSVQARTYKQDISGKRSSGVATITTTGDLLDFCATIECQDSIIEKTTTKYRDNSRLFLSPSYNTNNQLNIGVDWNIKNKFLLKGGIGYDIQNTTPYISLGIGIPIF